MADDLLAVARDRARSNRFWQHLGIDVAEVREGWARLRRGRTVAFGEVRVTDDARALVAVGRATYLILPSRAREASG
ncbi:MAG: hypothetical protein DMD76_08310 [Candidatus Rokuibacteriota bacterium]|nr:MAG: hypothetical protein DMD76_08310 [Candidatus Rokubacteria bacterium]